MRSIFFGAGVCLVLALNVSTAAEPKAFADLVREYTPPLKVNWEKYDELAHEFDLAWGRGVDAEAALDRLNRYVEPEALIALYKILEDPNSELFYGGFDPLRPSATSGPDYEPSTLDGLVGLRVIRQARAGRFLLSSIQAEERHGAKLWPRAGRDSLRIRIQVDRFEIGDPRVIGFSWTTEVNTVGELTAIRAESYVTDDAEKAFGRMHHGMKFKDVTPCGFASHCNLCHHQDRLNSYSAAYRKAPPESWRGFRELLESAERDTQLQPDQLQKLREGLKQPRQTFSNDELRRAVLARWKLIQTAP